METKIVLDARRFVRIPDTLVAGQTMILSFESSIYELGMLGVSITNGVKKGTLVLEGDNKVDITEYLDRAGKVDITVELIAKGVVVKKWQLDSIVVREVEQDLEIVPMVVDFEKRLARMEDIIIEFNQKLNDSL